MVGVGCTESNVGQRLTNGRSKNIGAVRFVWKLETVLGIYGSEFRAHRLRFGNCRPNNCDAQVWI